MEESAWEGEEKRQGRWDDGVDDEAEGGTGGLTVTTPPHQLH